MRFSYNWLKELSGTRKTPEQIAEILTMHSFEVEEIEKLKNDAILEIKILSNRGHDCLGHLGMAREICAIEEKQSKFLEAKLPKKGSKILKVEISAKGGSARGGKDKKLCSRYIGIVMSNIKVAPSPKWMREKLETCGIRPINNIIDATNYVMLELGQPLHAFDLEKISSESGIRNQESEEVNIIIRRAKEGEEIKLLDGTVKKLTSEDIVIANENKALALAGIMGGEESGVTAKTAKIVLESANFDAKTIRKSRIRLELQTDSSLRFEKEIDPNLAELAMARAIEIIEAMGGKTEGAVDAYPSKAKPWKIKLDLNYVNKLLGGKIPAKIISKILKNLGLRATGYGLQITTTIPTFRLDLQTQEDLIEEIGRIYGYEKIKAQVPMAQVQTPPVNEPRNFVKDVRNILAGKGFSEVYNYSFYSERDANLAQIGSIEHLELENPGNPDQKLMRVSLIPGILKNINHNLKYFDDFRIFEIGHVYWPNKTILPEEKNMLAGCVIIDDRAKALRAHAARSAGFYELKSYADALLDRLGIDDYYFDTFDAVPSDSFSSLWHEGRTAEIKIEGVKKAIGFLGEINPFVLANFDIHKRAACFEFDLEKLREISEGEREYEPLRKYPTVARDISMVSSRNILVDEILQVIQKAGGNPVLDIDLFDIFDFADETSSYAFHIIFGADDRTLESKEVDKIMEKINSSLEKELGVKVRK